MNTETINPSHEGHEEANSEATSSPLDAMWAGLTPAPKNAAAAIVEPAEDLGEADDAAEPDTNDVPGPLADRSRANAMVKRVIANRLVAAREMNGWGQTEAALQLGYKNATQLSLVEQGKRMPPPVVLIQIAKVYGVSVDYVLGLSDESERDPRTASIQANVNQIRDLLDRNAVAVVTALHEAHRLDTSQELRASGIVSKVQSLCDAVEKFRASNDSFDDSKCSANLVFAAKQARDSIEQVDDLLAQAKRRSEFAMRHGRAAMASTAGVQG